MKAVRYDHLDSKARQLPRSPNEAAFVPLGTMDALGLTQNMRMAVLWDVVEAGDVSLGGKHQCTIVGETITVQAANGVDITTTTCVADQLVTGLVGADRGAYMRARTAQAQQIWQVALRVRPVMAPIEIAPAVLSSFNLSVTSVPDVDLVVIMTARPSPYRSVSGYASCQQTDQHNRCTVGWLNWVPELLNVGAAADPTASAADLHTALHELTHVLGGMNPGSSAANSPFLNATTGQPLDPRGNVFIVEMDPGYAKPVTKIVTPRVLNLTRSAYGCPTATGMPLEDVDLGRGAHWEARVTGPEFMSYGTGSGQVYVSDLTLAYLEDTNQYIVNYSAAGGPLLRVGDVDDFVSAGASLGSPVASADFSPPMPLSPGYPMWGRGAGCAFLTGNALTSAWPPAYTCTQNQRYGCTADNRMSAVCVVSASYTSEAACGSWYVDEASGALVCGFENNACVGANCGVPSIFQPFASSAAAAAASVVSSATAASTGGFSNAMDYVPVQVGYWGCNVATAVTNATAGTTESGGSIADFADLFGSSADMATFGGQARCPNCRCMLSSLMGLAQAGFTPAVSAYGLCYRTNCFRSDYLQVAVMGRLWWGTNTAYWYRCPAGGGAVYIVGFTGTLQCPDPAAFCALETVSGIQYPEQSFLIEIIVLGVLGGISLLLLLSCACPCSRNRLVLCFKRCCGVLRFPEEESELPKQAESDSGVRSTGSLQQRHVSGLIEGPSVNVTSSRLAWSWASGTVVVVSVATGLAGLALAGATIFSIAAAGVVLSADLSVMGIATLVCAASAVGICAGRKRARAGPSCWLLVYIAASTLVLLVLLYSISYTLGFSEWQDLLADNWDAIALILPSQATAGATSAQQLAAATAYVESNLPWLATIAALACAAYAAALLAAASLVPSPTLAAVILAVASHVLTALGLAVTGAGAYLLVKYGSGGGGTSVAAAILGAGLVAGTAGSLGMVTVLCKAAAARGRWRLILGSFLFALAALTGLLVYCVWLFAVQGPQVGAFADSLSDAQMALAARDLGLSGSKAQLVEALRNDLGQLTVAAAEGIGICLVLLVAGARYWRALAAHQRNERYRGHHREVEEAGVELWPAPLAASGGAVAVPPRVGRMFSSRLSVPDGATTATAAAMVVPSPLRHVAQHASV